ncbi:hypothetical protein ASE92_06785 [Pedobacter sp. Leaf41]|jgi:hypothetical protein|nr:hypothetical protein ASE92_06785 [Pedobacter sp. Leaf41]
MSNVKISSAGVADFAIVQDIAKKTFYETFSSSNSEQTMQDYLFTSFSDEKGRQSYRFFIFYCP